MTCLDIAFKNNTPLKHPEWNHYHHFSFIVQDSKIVGFGTNRCSSPLTFLGYADHTKMHSETDAYFKCKGILEKDKRFEMVNIRLTNTNKIASSQPCKCCSAFLSNMKCTKIWFTTNINKFACIVF